MREELVVQLPVTEALKVGGGGWVRYRARAMDALGAVAYVRFVEVAGRLEARDICIESDAPLSSATLRQVPIGHIQAWANSPTHAQALRERMGSTPRSVNLSDHFGGAPEALGSFAALNLRLVIPGSRDKGDSFYQDVASIYSALSAHGRRAPAAELAAANAVPVSTAYRWVKEARHRGYLPPGRSGKAG